MWFILLVLLHFAVVFDSSQSQSYAALVTLIPVDVEILDWFGEDLVTFQLFCFSFDSN